MFGRRKRTFFVSGSKKLELTLPSNFFTLNTDITNSLSDLKEAADNIDKFSDKPSINKLFQQVPTQETNIHTLAKQLPTEYQALCYAIFVIYLKHSATPLSDITQLSFNDFKEKYQSKFESISTSKLHIRYEIDEEKWRTLHAYRDIIVLISSILPFHGNKALMLNIAGLLVDKQLASLGSGATIFNQLRVAIYEGEGQIKALKRKQNTCKSTDSVSTHSFWNKRPIKKGRVVEQTSINHKGSSPIEVDAEMSVSSNLSVFDAVPPVLSHAPSDKEASLIDVFDDESISPSPRYDFELSDSESRCSNYERFYNELNTLKNTRDDDSVYSEISFSFSDG